MMDIRLLIFLNSFYIGFGLRNNIPDASLDETECLRRMNYLTDVNLNTKIISPPLLTGKWVSERCEVRTGPHYILRSYTFNPDNSFDLLQFFYTDDTCSVITHVVNAKGTFKYKDRYMSKLLYDLSLINIVPYDMEFKNNLPWIVGSRCLDTTIKKWELFQEYTLYDKTSRLTEILQNTDRRKMSKNARTFEKNSKSDIDMKCLSLLNVSFDELYTLRIHQRPAIDDKNIRYELLLGSSHPYQENMRKTFLKFQLPLILLNETNDCPICRIIGPKDKINVPHLEAKTMLPLFFNGEWISQSCEPRSTGVFTIRKYRFNQLNREWGLETHYYSNYVCSILLMVHQVSGHYIQGRVSEIVFGATEIDFEIEKSYLTIADDSVKENLETDPICGSPYWKINVTKEMPSKYGCSSIGLNSSLVKYDIIKLDWDYDGSYILWLGDEGSVKTEQDKIERPTAYEYPLVQCNSEPQYFPELRSPSSANTIRFSFTMALIWVLRVI